MRWFPVPMIYLTANAKSGFSSLQDGVDGRQNGLSKVEALPSVVSQDVLTLWRHSSSEHKHGEGSL